MRGVLAYFLKVPYILGLFVVVPLALAGVFGLGDDGEVRLALMLLGVVYALAGYAVLRWLPQRVRTSVMKHVRDAQAARGFTPSGEGVSVLLNRYMAWDASRKLFHFSDIATKRDIFVPFDEVNSWEIAPSRPALVTVNARHASIAEKMSMVIGTAEVNRWANALETQFGT